MESSHPICSDGKFKSRSDCFVSVLAEHETYRSKTMHRSVHEVPVLEMLHSTSNQGDSAARCVSRPIHLPRASSQIRRPQIQPSSNQAGLPNSERLTKSFSTAPRNARLTSWLKRARLALDASSSSRAVLHRPELLASEALPSRARAPSFNAASGRGAGNARGKLRRGSFGIHHDFCENRTTCAWWEG